MFFKRTFLYLVLIFSTPLCGMDIETGNAALFEKIKEDLIWARAGLPTLNATASDCRRLGYNGQLIPIVLRPQTIRGGYIVQNAQPSKWFGYWYDTASEPEDLILIEDRERLDAFEEDPEIIYEARIIHSKKTRFNVASACLVWDASRYIMNYRLALLWQALEHTLCPEHANGKYYITTARLDEIKKEHKIFDLDKDKVAVTLRPERSQ